MPPRTRSACPTLRTKTLQARRAAAPRATQILDRPGLPPSGLRCRRPLSSRGRRTTGSRACPQRGNAPAGPIGVAPHPPHSTLIHPAAQPCPRAPTATRGKAERDARGGLARVATYAAPAVRGGLGQAARGRVRPGPARAGQRMTRPTAQTISFFQRIRTFFQNPKP
jgi:hypothetical protein